MYDEIIKAVMKKLNLNVSNYSVTTSTIDDTVLMVLTASDVATIPHKVTLLCDDYNTESLFTFKCIRDDYNDVHLFVFDIDFTDGLYLDTYEKLYSRHC